MPSFNRWDICEAYYVYATLWHMGQGSWSYGIFGRLNKIDYHPKLMFLAPEDLNENARLIYDRLVERNTLTAVNE